MRTRKADLELLGQTVCIPPSGTQVRVRVAPMTVTIGPGGQAVATHERCYRRRQQVLELEHYLDVLIHKPGALAGSTPLAQWRTAGRWTAAHDQLWAGLRERRGAQEGTRQMIERLHLGRQQGYEPLPRAIEQALICGAYDAAAVRWLLTAPPLAPPAEPSLAPTDLTPSEHVTRPLPSLDGYDPRLAPAAAAIQETVS